MFFRIRDLADEAGDLYVLSKELVTLNKLLKKLTLTIKIHVHKHSMAKTEEEKLYHRTKHARTTVELGNLLKKHYKLLEKLKRHHRAFDYALRKEQKI